MSNYTTVPSHETIEKCIDLGFVVTAAAGYPDLSTLDLVPFLLHNASVAEVNAAIGPFLPGLDVTKVLEELNNVLPQLPRDETWLKYRPIPNHSIVLCVVQIISMIVVAARIYVRKYVTPKRLRAEDWVCMLALFIETAWICLMGAQNMWAGRHIYTLSLNQIKNHQLYMNTNGLLFHATHVSIKHTFLVFYYRLYSNRRYHMAVIAVSVYVFTVSIIPFSFIAFGCRPLDFWNHLLTAKCWDRLKVLTFAGAALIVADFMILSLPVPVILRMRRLQLRDKLLLIAMFSLGGFISIASIIRLEALKQWLTAPDFTYAFGKHLMWASVEAVLSLVVACAPAIKAGISHAFSNEAPAAGLPKGFSKWSFTPGGMFKRSNRTRRTGNGPVSMGPEQMAEKGADGSPHGKRGVGHVLGREGLESTVDSLNLTTRTTTTCTSGTRKDGDTLSSGGIESRKELFILEESKSSESNANSAEKRSHDLESG